MQTIGLRRHVVLGAVWAYAAATWASIAHHLVGLPDVVLLAGLVAFVTPSIWSYLRSERPITDSQPMMAHTLDAAEK